MLVSKSSEIAEARPFEQLRDRRVQVLVSPNTWEGPCRPSASASSIFNARASDSASRRARMARREIEPLGISAFEDRGRDVLVLNSAT